MNKELTMKQIQITPTITRMAATCGIDTTGMTGQQLQATFAAQYCDTQFCDQHDMRLYEALYGNVDHAEVQKLAAEYKLNKVV